MAVSAQDFLNKYPWLDDDPDDVINTWLDAYPGQTFEQALVTKPELVDAVAQDPRFGHQLLIELYLSEETPYRETLLFHAPGTGKTCTVVRVAERAKAKGTLKGCLVLARGMHLLKNFVHELVFNSNTNDVYIPDGYKDMSDQERSRKVHRAVSGFYQFKTYETFAKMVSRTSNAQIKAQYDNHLIVFDEVHHLKSSNPDGISTYNSLTHFLHIITGCVKMLLSGTPMANAPIELADVMNLILPPQLRIFPEDNIFSSSRGDLLNPAELARRIKGRVSYLKAAQPNAGLVYAGGPPRLPLTGFQTVSLPMGQTQARSYAVAWARDFGDHNIFSNSRQVALAVLPDGSWGTDIDTNRSKRTITTMLENLGEYSSKYAYLLRVAETSAKTFAYCEFVNGSGLLLLVDLLLASGWSQATGKDTTRGKRFVLLTAGQRHIQPLVQRFNKSDNVDGDYISLLLGSRVVAEGLTFKAIRNMLVLTPHWNYTETAQAIARAWRVGSHDQLLDRGENVNLVVHRLVSEPPTGSSIDTDMYFISETKDKKIKGVERLLMETAQDCALLYSRNKYDSSYDNTRDCEYTSCEHVCNGVTNPNQLQKRWVKTSKITDIRAVDQLRKMGGAYASALVSTMDDYSVDLTSLWALVASGARFPDRWGDPAVVRAAGNRLELAGPYSPMESGPWGDFYKTRRLTYARLNAMQLSQDKLRTEIPSIMSKLLTSYDVDNVGAIAANLPEPVQQLLLTSCLLAREKGLTKNALRRDAILEFYSGFYAQGPSGWTTWLFSQGPTAQYLGSFDMTWRPADEPTIKFLEKHQQKLTNSSIGYYGLYNPALKDFCIRDMTKKGRSEEDLRKLTVGRRCVDWDQRTLNHIIVRLMKINALKDFLSETSLDDLIAMVKKDPHHKEEDLKNRKTCRRFLYWTQKGETKFRRQDMCGAMELWFRESNLMEDNFDCGHQRKKRIKFAA